MYALLALLLAALVVWLRTAWVSDDAGITLRAVLNFTHGLGPNFNVGERVQVFTHPLWFFLLSAIVGISRELYYSTLGLSLLCTLLALYGLARHVSFSPPHLLAAACLLLGSRAFVDYSSSGLENPLTHLLLAGFVLALYRPMLDSTRRQGMLFLLAALLVLNRLDTAWLVLPALLGAAWLNPPWSRWLGSALRYSPLLLAWFGFALFYYGALLPNTAYAKLDVGISASELWRQGGAYLLDSLQRDRVTLPVIAVALIYALLRGDWRQRTLAVGIASYLLYTLSVGGDFMSGRFLSAPYFLSVLLLLSLLPGRQMVYALAVVAFTLSLFSPRPTWLSGTDFADGQPNAHGITDERGFYYPNTGLLSSNPPPIQQGLRQLDWSWREQSGVRQVYTLGLAGLVSGPEVHVFDPLGLADPLLSRLPQGYGDAWRPGHFQRRIPAGFMESLERDANYLRHPQLAALYDDIRTMTRGDLLQPGRWSAIWRVNTGYHRVVDSYNRLSDEDVLPGEAFYSPLSEQSP